MPKFLYAYHGGKRPQSPEEGKAIMEAWYAWIDSSNGALVDKGNPVGMSKTIDGDGVHDNGGTNPIMGFSMVEMADESAALELAGRCPHISLMGGSVEVAQIMEM